MESSEKIVNNSKLKPKSSIKLVKPPKPIKPAHLSSNSLRSRVKRVLSRNSSGSSSTPNSPVSGSGKQISDIVHSQSFESLQTRQSRRNAM